MWAFVCLVVAFFEFSLATSPNLQPLLRFENGSVVSTPEAWMQRRQEVGGLLQESMLGTLPDIRPPLRHSRVLNKTSYASSDAFFVRLDFDVSAGKVMQSCEFEVEVLSPIENGMQRPLFLTQWNHREWALIGLSRGYVGVVYPGADVRDAAPCFQLAYPNRSMALIVARAFVASCVLDYALSLPHIARDEVSITGHSRNGKQSLIAAAYDTRITAVVGSSAGSPISTPWRFTSRNWYGELPDTAVFDNRSSSWWLPSVGQWNDNPSSMPIDGHGVLGMIAPRCLMLATAFNDMADHVLGVESAALEAGKIFKLLGVEDRWRILYRPGRHHGFLDVNTYFDWFDWCFGRAALWMPAFQQSFVSPAAFNWRTWNSSTHHPPQPPPSATLSDRVRWLLALGKDWGSPTGFNMGSSYAEEGTRGTEYVVSMMRHDVENVTRQTVSFGNFVTGSCFWPKNLNSSAARPVPAIIWLHPYSYATGYVPTDCTKPSQRQSRVFEELSQAGFFVLTYDQIGFGTRNMHGGARFYSRYGSNASLLGHMVNDVMAAVDFLFCRTPRGRSLPQCSAKDSPTHTYPNDLEQLPYVDADQIFVAGYSLGGNVALHAAALDARIAGVASFAGFTPMRTDTANSSTGGLARLFDLHALVPRLGHFEGHELDVPYDYKDLLEAVAPRPIFLYTPKKDRDANYIDVLACVQSSFLAWKSLGVAHAFTHKAPDDGTRMESVQVQELSNWLLNSSRWLDIRSAAVTDMLSGADDVHRAISVI